MDKAMELFNGCYPDIRLVYPQRVRRRRLSGKTYLDEIVPLLPDYMFFETDHDLPKGKPRRSNFLLRLLIRTKANGNYMERTIGSHRCCWTPTETLYGRHMGSAHIPWNMALKRLGWETHVGCAGALAEASFILVCREMPASGSL
jgi:hypothetical protein